VLSSEPLVNDHCYGDPKKGENIDWERGGWGSVVVRKSSRVGEEEKKGGVSST